MLAIVEQRPCPICATPLTPKSRPLLIAVGVALFLPLLAALLNRWWLVLALPIASVGAYLLLWATYGRAEWCRTCKLPPAFVRRS
jgi:hypothetical protein